jgi:hypothetical protein
VDAGSKSLGDPLLQHSSGVGGVWVMGMAGSPRGLFPVLHSARMRRRDYGAYNSWRADSTRSRN